MKIGDTLAMSYCPFCGTNHDSDVSCDNLTEQILRDAERNHARLLKKEKWKAAKPRSITGGMDGATVAGGVSLLRCCFTLTDTPRRTSYRRLILGAVFISNPTSHIPHPTNFCPKPLFPVDSGRAMR